MTEINIRQITPDDAEAFLRLMKTVDGETTFMMRKSGERTETIQEEYEYLQNMLKNPRMMIFVAEDGGRLVGYIKCFSGSLQRNSHTAAITVGIVQSHIGKGLGTRLFEVMEAWARSIDLHRLELHVDTGNTAGIALYTKRGFVVEGVAKEIKFVGGHYQDEIMMAKIL